MSTVVNIMNLSADVRAKDLRRLFERIGKVGKIEFYIPEPISGYARGALLEIANFECAQDSVLKFDDERLKRRKMYVTIPSYRTLLKRGWIKFEQEEPR